MMKRAIRGPVCVLATVLAALVGGCGSGGGGGESGAPPTQPPVVPVVLFTLGGTVSGLGPGAVVTLANGSEKLAVAANGPFAFPLALPSGTSFAITATAPGGYTCKVSDGSGTIAGANSTKTAVNCAPVVLAGVVSRLQLPRAVTSDGNGNLYVLNRGDHSVMRLSSSGTWTVLAGGAARPGNVDGAGGNARFRFGDAADLVADAQGNLLIGDSCNHTVRKLAADGNVSTLAGRAYGCSNLVQADSPALADGSGAAAVFEAMGPMVADGAGGAFMIELANGGVLRHVSAAGAVTSRGFRSSRGTSVNFIALARGADGTLYLADDDQRIWTDVDADSLLELVAGGAPGSGSIDAAGAAARFSYISDMVVAPGGDLYVADRYAVRKVTPAGQVTTVAGDAGVRGNVDGQGRAARFGAIVSLTLDGAGLVALDSEQGILRRVSLDGTATTVASTPAVRGNTNGTGAAAQIAGITSLAADADGNLYFAYSGSHIVRKASPDGTVTTIGGTQGVSGRADGPLASATFAAPNAVAAGRDGSLWVLQGTGLRRIKDGTVTTPDPFIGGRGLVIDADGNAIVSTGIDSGEVVRITPAGQKTVLMRKEDVWNLTKDADTWFIPQSLAVDGAGNIYVADTGSVAVYKLSKSGAISLFAGTMLKETGDVDGPAGTATLGFYEVDYMTIDEAGNLYLSGQGGVRMISPAGVVSSPAFVWGQAHIGALAYALLQSGLP
jgi:sugar lactone lactonase YvrE